VTRSARAVAAIARLMVRSVVRVYPTAFRARFGQAIVDDVEHDLAEAQTRGGWVPLGVCLRESASVCRGLLPEWWRSLRGRSGLQLRRESAGGLGRDFRYAARSLRSSPHFTAVALVVLALGIGSTTTIASVVDAVLIRGLPFDEYDRLVVLVEADPAGAEVFGGGKTTPQTFLDWRRMQSSFDGVGALGLEGWVPLDLGGGQELYLRRQAITVDLLPTLRVPVLHGRQLSADDEAIGAGPVALLSHDFWMRQFGGSVSVLGEPIVLGGVSHEVVGVLPGSFSYPVDSDQPAEVFTAVAFGESDRTKGRGRNFNFTGIARLKPGVSLAIAQARMYDLGVAIDLDAPGWLRGNVLRVETLQRHITGPVEKWMWLLFAGVSLLMLIACANVANLTLVRAHQRAEELGLRAALGASRLQLIRGVFVESLLLALVGTALALLLGWTGIRVVHAWIPAGMPRVAAIALDGRIFLLAALCGVFTALVCAIAPAAVLTRNAHSRAAGVGRAISASRGSQRLRSAFVVAEVALAALLFGGAGLFFVSFIRVSTVDIGFDYRHLVQVEVSVPRSVAGREAREAQGRLLALAAIDAVRGVPGVVAAEAVTGGVPLARGWTEYAVILPGRGKIQGSGLDLGTRKVSEGYLQALGFRLLGGRHLTQSDREGAEPVIVVNETAARLYWPGQSAVGQFLTLTEDGELQRRVVGVVGDVRHHGPEVAARPEGYVPLRQSRTISVAVVARTAGAPGPSVPAIKAAIRRIDPTQRFGQDRPALEDELSRFIAQRRFNMAILTLFGTCGLLIAVVGIYGVVAFVVSQRTAEFGLRIALGATPRAVVFPVFGRIVGLVGTGLLLGTLVAWQMRRILEAFLYSPSESYVGTFLVALAILAISAMAAALAPAMRAARIDPVRALRSD
jgi:putative ABC transport system permease protein